jgi:uncharacterized coiled-coil protein SlyX
MNMSSKNSDQKIVELESKVANMEKELHELKKTCKKLVTLVMLSCL